MSLTLGYKSQVKTPPLTPNSRAICVCRLLVHGHLTDPSNFTRSPQILLHPRPPSLGMTDPSFCCGHLDMSREASCHPSCPVHDPDATSSHCSFLTALGCPLPSSSWTLQELVSILLLDRAVKPRPSLASLPDLPLLYSSVGAGRPYKGSRGPHLPCLL